MKSTIVGAGIEAIKTTFPLLNIEESQHDPENPIVVDKGVSYMRFDGLVIARTEDGGVKTSFMWRGQPHAELVLPGPFDLSRGNILSLTGIEGRQMLRISEL